MDSSSIENFLSARVFFYTYWNYQMNLKFAIELERTQIAVCRNILILAINERRSSVQTFKTLESASNSQTISAKRKVV